MVKNFLRISGAGIKSRLSKLSFSTGVLVLVMCVPFYIVSFVQMALPIPTSVKGVLWVVFFGLAKMCQYGGLTIVGAEGVKRIKEYLGRKKGKG